MTWEEVCNDRSLQNLPYKIELNQWGHIEMSRINNRHGEVQGAVGHMLHLQKPDGVTVINCAIQTAENVKVPDVTWTSFARYDTAASPDIVYTDTAPEICVEVVLPSNMLEEQMHKGGLYLQAGAVEFWLCDERGNVRFFDAGGELERSRLCPGFPLEIELRR